MQEDTRPLGQSVEDVEQDASNRVNPTHTREEEGLDADDPTSSSQGRATGMGGLSGELVAENQGAVTGRRDGGLGNDADEDENA